MIFIDWLNLCIKLNTSVIMESIQWIKWFVLKIWDYSVYFRFILKVGTLREVLLFSLPRNLKLIIVFTITMITNKVLYLIINIRLITAKKSFIYFKIMFVGGYSWKKINLYRFSRNGYILTYRHQLHVILFFIH